MSLAQGTVFSGFPCLIPFLYIAKHRDKKRGGFFPPLTASVETRERHRDGNIWGRGARKCAATQQGGELRAAGGCCADGPANMGRGSLRPCGALDSPYRGRAGRPGGHFPALVTGARGTGGVQPRERVTGRFPSWRPGALLRSRPKAPGLEPKARRSAAAAAGRSRAVRGEAGPPAGEARAAQASGWRRRQQPLSVFIEASGYCLTSPPTF